MRPVFWFVNTMVKAGTAVLCRIDAPDLDKVPEDGPLIVYSNHTGQIEVPVTYSHLQPRPVRGIAKVETWDGWFLRWIFNLWGVIPIRRGEADLEAMRKSLEALEKGYVLAIAPEGTRNKNGRLIGAHPGVITLALRSGALGRRKLPDQPETIETDRFPYPRGGAFQAEPRNGASFARNPPEDGRRDDGPPGSHATGVLSRGIF